MQKVFWVCNGDLAEVNKCLQKGGKIVQINAVSECVSASVTGDGWSSEKLVGDIYAYIVVEI